MEMHVTFNVYIYTKHHHVVIFVYSLTGVIVSVETQAEKKIEQQKRLREEVEHELEKFRQYCTVQEKEIEVLREELKRHGISIGKIECIRSGMVSYQVSFDGIRIISSQ